MADTKSMTNADPRSYDAEIAQRAARTDDAQFVVAPDLMGSIRDAARDAAYDAWKRTRDRDDILAITLNIKTWQILNVIDLTGSGDRSPHTGAYVIEYKAKTGQGDGDTVWFTTVVDGKRDGAHFLARPLATLHALARQVGIENGDFGVTAGFAARVLNIPTTDN